MYSLNILRIFAAVFMTRILNQTASMNFYHNTILETLFGTVLLILCSCSGSSDDIKVNDPVRYSVIMKGMSFSDSSSADEEVSEVTAFQFSDGLLSRSEWACRDFHSGRHPYVFYRERFS